MPSPRILIIDADHDVSQLIELMLHHSNSGYELRSVQTAEEGLRLAASQCFDLFVLDYRLPGMSGAEVCRAIRLTDAETPVLFFTGAAYERERHEAMKAGASAYLVKPDDLKKLTETVQLLIGRNVSRSARKGTRAPAYLSST
ncbi:MAG TPA: response regulator [Pyrinomonadaceae bacterium]|nr:response regulator [Pyrinomonadaceae bacterium]